MHCKVHFLHPTVFCSRHLRWLCQIYPSMQNWFSHDAHHCCHSDGVPPYLPFLDWLGPWHKLLSGCAECYQWYLFLISTAPQVLCIFVRPVDIYLLLIRLWNVWVSWRDILLLIMHPYLVMLSSYYAAHVRAIFDDLIEAKGLKERRDFHRPNKVP